jgi:hypothetical protein
MFLRANKILSQRYREEAETQRSDTHGHDRQHHLSGGLLALVHRHGCLRQKSGEYLGRWFMSSILPATTVSNFTYDRLPRFQRSIETLAGTDSIRSSRRSFPSPSVRESWLRETQRLRSPKLPKTPDPLSSSCPHTLAFSGKCCLAQRRLRYSMTQTARY